MSVRDFYLPMPVGIGDKELFDPVIDGFCYRCSGHLVNTGVFCEPCWNLRGLCVAPSRIPDSGNGLFATRPFLQGSKIVQYTGKIISDFEAKDSPNQAYHVHVGDFKVIDASDIWTSSIARYANDASFPNGKVRDNNAKILTYRNGRLKDTAWLVATRDIDIGDEITFSYGLAYWSKLALRDQRRFNLEIV